jgi:hypothetical protein
MCSEPRRPALAPKTCACRLVAMPDVLRRMLLLLLLLLLWQHWCVLLQLVVVRRGAHQSQRWLPRAGRDRSGGAAAGVFARRERCVGCWCVVWVGNGEALCNEGRAHRANKQVWGAALRRNRHSNCFVVCEWSEVCGFWVLCHGDTASMLLALP